MDGRQAFLCMLAVDPGIPIVLSSGYGEREALRDFEARGLAGFLPKPYQRIAFQSVLREAMEGSSSGRDELTPPSPGG